MDNVQIIVLVVMCVVFVSVASVMIFVIVRWDKWGRRGRRYVNDNTVDGEHVLHFFDLSGISRALEIHAMSVRDGPSLQLAIASHCGLQDPSTLSLRYVNEVGRSVEVDLDQLVRCDEELGKRMGQTAICPLILHRNEGLLVPSGTKRQQQQQQQEAADSIIMSRAPAEIEINYKHENGRGASKHSEDAKISDSSFGGGGGGVVPPPIIMPRHSHITSTTPVTILATQYVIEDDGTVLDEDDAALIGNAVTGGGRHTVTLTCGARVTVDSERRAVWLLHHGEKHGGQRLLPQSAEVLRYTVDNMSASQWYPYKQPFFLPPGRWCVRAESSTADHRYVETCSRVFTVDVVGRSR